MIVLDTNVLSEMMRVSPSRRVLDWVADHPAADLFLTTITEAEIFYGIELLPRSRRRTLIYTAAEAIFSEDFRGRILPFDSRAAQRYATVVAHRHKSGHPISMADAQIASIALAHNAPVATRNLRDFEGCGLQLHNPWLHSS